MLHRISAQLESVHSKMDACGCNCGPFGPFEKGTVLNEAYEQRGCLSNRIFVVARLRSEYHRLQRTQISPTIRATELVDEDVVNSDRFDNAEVFSQLLGQLFVEHSMSGDRSLEAL